MTLKVQVLAHKYGGIIIISAVIALITCIDKNKNANIIHSYIRP